MSENKSRFRSRLRAGEKLLGTMVTLASPSVAELLASLGFDWLFVDGEHGPLDPPDLVGILQAVGGQAACIVRVPTGEEAPIKRVLDIGADGIIVPQVNSAEHAARIVDHARYSPLGSRGVGLARAHGYGSRFQEYLESANDTVSVIVQAEHIRGVECIEDIVKVEGVDAVQLGPYDLSASMGKMGQIQDPEVVAAIDHVIKTCVAADMPVGWFGLGVDAVRPYIDRGCTLITTSVDTVFLADGATNVLSELR